MASESTEEGGVNVELPPDLDEWLDERTAAVGEPRDALVRQLLASYRAATELDNEEALGTLVDVDGAVEAAMQDELDAAVAAAVDNVLEEQVDSTVRDRLPGLTDAVESRLDDRFESIDQEFQEKITDVRKRVVQLKRDLDGKAPADHDAFDTVTELEGDVTELNRELVEVRDELEEHVSRQGERLGAVEQRLDDIEGRFDDIEDKLKRVAWVVSDLRDDQGGRDDHEKAVNRIKRAAAQEGITSASCQSCGDSVEVALLTEPQCPHCNSTVSNVRPDGGFIRKKATLVTAKQLEAGPSDE